MTREEALKTWMHCAQVCHRAGSFYLEENDGGLERKLRPYPDAVIETVEAVGIWPSGRYTAVVKVIHVAEVPAVPARPPLPGREAVPAKYFYLAVR